MRLPWHEALAKFSHDVSFEQSRNQIGRGGGDQLIPHFEDAQRDHNKALEEWRGKCFKTEYLPRGRYALHGGQASGLRIY